MTGQIKSKERVEKQGIFTEGLSFHKVVHTTLAFVNKLPNGDRDFSFYRNPGADIMISADDIKNAKNIKVDNPQGAIKYRQSENTSQIPGVTYYNPIVIEGKGDFHNSHNRVQDWIKYTK